MTLKDNSAKQILIAAVITILLQSGIVAGMALHGKRISDNERVIYNINHDYIPTWFLQGLIENMNYQTEEIVATMDGDQTKVHEINVKYVAFQKTMMNNLIQMRGGISNTQRDGSNIKKSDDNTKNK